jgi:hypothetical protein
MVVEAAGPSGAVVSYVVGGFDPEDGPVPGPDVTPNAAACP